LFFLRLRGNKIAHVKLIHHNEVLVVEIDSASCRVATNFSAEPQRIARLNLILARVFYMPLQIEFSVALSDPEREAICSGPGATKI
jgi:hypothetical protein